MQQNLRITRPQFCGALLVCLAILGAGNFTVQCLTAHTISRRLLADTSEATHAQIIALGNSLMRSGFVPEVFAPPALPNGKSPAFNLAMGASTPIEQLLLLRAGLQSFASPRLLLYGFYDFQLTDPVSFSNADLIGNHDILYYQEPAFARRFYQMNQYESAAFEIDRRASLLAERGAVWAKVELLRRGLGQQGMPAQATSQFGRAADFTLLEAKNREEFEQHCSAASEADLNAPVAEIIRGAQQNGIKVVFIVMPLPPKHVQAFYDSVGWNTYQRHIRRLLRAQNVAYLDASRWIPDASKFGDALHLTPAGAQEFSHRLGELCSILNDLSSCSSPEK